MKIIACHRPQLKMEKQMLPSAAKVAVALGELLGY